MNSSPVILPAKRFRINRLIWCVLVITMVLDVIVASSIGLGIRVLFIPQFIFIMGACAATSLGYTYICRDDNMRLFGNVMNQFLCAGFAIAMAVGIGAYANAAQPLCDETLIAIDKIFGFDWHSYVNWVDAHPWLVSLFSFSYQVFTVLIATLICALFLYKESAQAQRFIMSFYITGMITAVLSGLFPAVAAYVHYNVDVTSFSNLRPAAGRIHEAIMMGLRSGQLTELVFPGIGIVTFPSFHSAGAVLLIYASLPLRYLRVVLIPLNIIMILSIPVDGGHYLIDVLAGIAIACIGIAVAEKLLPRRSEI